MTSNPIPTVGRLVLFVIPEGPNRGQVRPASVVAVRDPEAGLVDLRVLEHASDRMGYRNEEQAGGPSRLIPDPHALSFDNLPTSVPYQDAGEADPKEPGTWHWMPFQRREAAAERQAGAPQVASQVPAEAAAAAG